MQEPLQERRQRSWGRLNHYSQQVQATSSPVFRTSVSDRKVHCPRVCFDTAWSYG